MAAQSAREIEIAAHYGICGSELRAKNRDLWLAALYAPAALRRHIHALYAFNLEVAEIPGRVTQPILGEMRLRWWIDTLAQNAESARAHPIADALLETIASCALERDEFADFLDAHSADLYDDAIESTPALLDYCRRVSARPLLWSARCLGAAERRETRAALDNAGVAIGLTQIARGLAQGRGRQFLPPEILRRQPGLHEAAQELLRLAAEHYQAARAAEKELDDPGRIALLPAAILPLYFASFRAQKEEPSPWRRQWRLWRVARNGL
jgi:15-cis-phytoene synthase